MGLMDRDYWRDKHNPGWDRKGGKKVDLADLQRSIERGISEKREARSSVRAFWLRVLVWAAVASVLYAILRALGVGGH